MRKLSHQELLQRQSDKRGPRLSVCVLLNHVRSLYNVGSIFRTADGAGIEKVWLAGITGIPPDSKISKTALGAEQMVPWEYARNAGEILARLRAQNYQIVFLEQTTRSRPYQEFVPAPPLCLVVGNETAGVDEGLFQQGDLSLEIEMSGLKNSLNVAVAFGVVAYHCRRHLLINTPK